MSQKKQSYEISQWLQILKEPWKSRAIKAAKDAKISFSISGLRGRASTFYDALMDAFWWHEEGEPPINNGKEWDKIHDNPKKFVEPQYHHLLK